MRIKSKKQQKLALYLVSLSLVISSCTDSEVDINNNQNQTLQNQKLQDNEVQKLSDEAIETTVVERIGKAAAKVVETFSATVANVKADDNAPPLVKSAREQIGVTLTYDPAYVSLDFPMGDVPMHTGVCTDVVIRAYREQGKDLQVLVNKDMKQAWSKYPKIWGLKTTDRNIDHRRVPNLRVFFSRHGQKLKVTDNAEDYQAGDMVTWKVSGRPHLGIVSNKQTYKGVPLIIHNIGRGTQENDILFNYPITGHYRY